MKEERPEKTAENEVCHTMTLFCAGVKTEYGGSRVLGKFQYPQQQYHHQQSYIISFLFLWQ